MTEQEMNELLEPFAGDERTAWQKRLETEGATAHNMELMQARAAVIEVENTPRTTQERVSRRLWGGRK